MNIELNKTVFISYRRAAAAFIARAVFMDLRAHGYDVFMDVESLDSGTFDTMLLNQITVRSHFVIILAPGTLERCADENDWVRQEIEHAIVTQRNIVPLMVNNFSFDGTQDYLIGKLSELKRYNGISVPIDFFDEAMERLRNRFLKTSSQTVNQTISASEQQVVSEQIEEILNQPIPTKQELTAEYYFGLGYALQREGDLQAAITKYDEAIQVNPAYRRAYYNRGLVYHQLKDYTFALLDYGNALQIDPNYVKSYHNLGLVMYEIGRYSDAIENLTRAIELKPQYAIAYYNRSKARKALGDEQGAAEDYEMYLRFRTDDDQDDINELVGDKETSRLLYEGMTRPVEPTQTAAANTPLLTAVRTDSGRANTANQDTYYYFYASGHSDKFTPDFGCYIICDGFGENGTRLASTVVTVVSAQILKTIYLTMIEIASHTDQFIHEKISILIEQAHQSLEKKFGSGVSLTVAVFIADLVYFGHVGNTRAYFVYEGGIEQLTRDHSLAQRLVELEQITSEEALHHPQRNVLYRSLGQSNKLEVEVYVQRRGAGSRFVMCTQGLWRHVTDHEIQQITITNPPQEAAEKLITLANERGGTENITVMVL